MTIPTHFFKDVTLLITHYNRSNSLERLLHTFKEQGVSFEQIIVSDDASKPEHQEALQQLQQTYEFELLTTPKNRGLANNINKGQDAVNTAYTLYVQEDFVPTPLFAAKFADALTFMQQEQTLDYVRFYAYRTYPYLKAYGKGFSEMMCKPWYTNYKKIYLYSDHPHLRRSSFLQKFGRYPEGIKSDKAEYKMCISFIQKKGRGLVLDDYKSVFVQENTAAEPSTVQRSSWTNSKNPVIAAMRDVYRQLKYNYDLNFSK